MDWEAVDWVIWFGIKQAASSCEKGNEPSGSVDIFYDYYRKF